MSYRNGVLIAFASSCLGCALAFCAHADDPADPQSVARPGVLVFRNGRVIEGQILKTESHYVVFRRGGKIEVPRAQVETLAKDLEEVYQKKAERINKSDPEEHVRLSQWCLQVNLYQRAIEELERAGELLSDASRVQAMLETVRRMQARSATKDPSGHQDPSPPAGLPLTTHSPLTKSGAGGESDLVPVANAATHGQGKSVATAQVPAALVSSFSVRIQPLLVRSCAAAGCHDLSHARGLALERSSQPTPRTTQQNLRSVLSHIDVNDPENSPLLIQSLLAHGGSRRAALALGVRDPAYQTLLDWVRGAAGRPANKSRSEPPPAKDSSATVAKSAEAQPTGPDSNPTVTTAGRSEPVPPASRPRETVQPSRSVKPPMNDSYKPVDPFDPEAFNRQYSPRAAGQEP